MAMKLLSLRTSLTLFFMVCVAVKGDYELEVTFYRFDNPNQRCEECHLSNGSTVTAGCCDDMMTGDQCDSGQCEMYFTFCHERLLNTSSSSRWCPTMEIDRRNYSLSNTDGVSFGQKVFGLPNPLTFSGYQWEGTQFYMECKDRDFTSNNPDDLIDTLAIDIDIPVGASINRTTYTGTFNNTQVELCFLVVCAENYYGPDCTRYCTAVNCSGHGKCVDGVDSVSCQCHTGYTGELCEIDIDFCAGVNCSGNGQCMQNISSFFCLCNSSFTGALCETNTSECADRDCGPNRRCVEVGDSYICECDAGFTGEQCIDNCAGVNCSGHGECTTILNTYVCDCDVDFTGNHCQIAINDCTEVNCSGHGQCEDSIGNYSCVCDPGFTGIVCEHEIDHCVGVMCNNNGHCEDCRQGQCINGVDSYYCKCNSGYTGRHCETNIDDCSGVDCGKNKECLVTEDSYTCVCMEGFTGETCEDTVSSPPTLATEPKTNRSLGIIIGGAVGGIIVMLIILILVFLIIVMCLLRRNIKRMHYNVEDELKNQSVTPGDNPVYAAETHEQKVAGEECELKNPIYDSYTEHEHEPNTFTTTEERKFDNPIYEGVPQDEKAQAHNFNNENRPKPVVTETKASSNGTTTATLHSKVDHANPICSAEDRDKMVGTTNPLFTQSYDDRICLDSLREGSKQDTPCSLVKSSIYDEDFMKPDHEPKEEDNTGNVLETLESQQPSGAKQSYRRQDYEDVV